MHTEQFIDFLEGRLSEAERRRVEETLAADPDERAEFELTRDLHESLLRLRGPRPEAKEWDQPIEALIAHSKSDSASTPETKPTAESKPTESEFAAAASEVPAVSPPPAPFDAVPGPAAMPHPLAEQPARRPVGATPELPANEQDRSPDGDAKRSSSAGAATGSSSATRTIFWAIAASVVLCIGLALFFSADPREIPLIAGAAGVEAKRDEVLHAMTQVGGGKIREQRLADGRMLVEIDVPAERAADFYKEVATTEQPRVLARLPRAAAGGKPVRFTVTISPPPR